ncbi:hypothetical protein FB45DRAFT_922387 [Roridomyces roridus]|uniref:Uncharacterized protein n=1 Tax=Roridomyces roridus TaxID=1738132 RepID=A0AAD7FIH7_9AGAR|nr:hypothetical protein FB45DRAFT_922387 [Roridomyces roridus]
MARRVDRCGGFLELGLAIVWIYLLSWFKCVALQGTRVGLEQDSSAARLCHSRTYFLKDDLTPLGPMFDLLPSIYGDSQTPNKTTTRSLGQLEGVRKAGLE